MDTSPSPLRYPKAQLNHLRRRVLDGVRVGARRQEARALRQQQCRLVHAQLHGALRRAVHEEQLFEVFARFLRKMEILTFLVFPIFNRFLFFFRFSTIFSPLNGFIDFYDVFQFFPKPGCSWASRGA